MVARHFGVVEAVGSNPATQTIKAGILPAFLILSGLSPFRDKRDIYVNSPAFKGISFTKVNKVSVSNAFWSK